MEFGNHDVYLHLQEKKIETTPILLFTLGYKGDFNVGRVACGIRDFTCDNVGSFIVEFSAFNKFENAFVAPDFSEPTDIITGFGLERDVSSHIFTKSNLNLRVGINGFWIDIFVPIFDAPTRDLGRICVTASNYIGKRHSSISPCDRQTQGTWGEGTGDNYVFTGSRSDTSTRRDIGRFAIKGQHNRLGDTTSAWWVCRDEINRNLFAIGIFIATTPNKDNNDKNA